MSSLQDLWDMICSVLQTAELVDILDILVLSYIIYWALKLIRETRAGQLIKGILLLLIIYGIAELIDMKAISYLLSETLNIGVIALIILFQPELRRMLEKAGVTSWGNWLGSNSGADKQTWGKAIEAICDACVELSASSTGALIVIERQSRLGEQIDNGTILNAEPSKELFGNIFYNKTPLHDGAVIIRDGKILAAACFLPKPQNEERIDKRLGSRHRAAIGMSENSDAIVIVVSEETGAISVAEDGELRTGFTREQLHKLLTDRLIHTDNDTAIRRVARKIPFFHKKKNGKEQDHGVGKQEEQSGDTGTGDVVAGSVARTESAESTSGPHSTDV